MELAEANVGQVAYRHGVVPILPRLSGIDGCNRSNTCLRVSAIQ